MSMMNGFGFIQFIILPTCTYTYNRIWNRWEMKPSGTSAPPFISRHAKPSVIRFTAFFHLCFDYILLLCWYESYLSENQLIIAFFNIYLKVFFSIGPTLILSGCYWLTEFIQFNKLAVKSYNIEFSGDVN